MGSCFLKIRGRIYDLEQPRLLKSGLYFLRKLDTETSLSLTLSSLRSEETMITRWAELGQAQLKLKLETWVYFCGAAPTFGFVRLFVSYVQKNLGHF